MSMRNRLPSPSYGPKGLELTDEQFHDLHARLERVRRTSSTVTVDREAFRLLLSDHAKLYAHIDAIESQLRHPVAQ